MDRDSKSFNIHINGLICTQHIQYTRYIRYPCSSLPFGSVLCLFISLFQILSTHFLWSENIFHVFVQPSTSQLRQGISRTVAGVDKNIWLLPISAKAPTQFKLQLCWTELAILSLYPPVWPTGRPSGKVSSGEASMLKFCLSIQIDKSRWNLFFKSS